MKTIELGGGAEILVLEWQEGGGVDETGRYLAALTAKLAARRPFGMMFIFPNSKAQSKDAQRLRQAWLKENREEIARYCFGLAVLTDSALLQAVLSPIIRAAGRTRFGCECAFFTAREDAEVWLRQRHSVMPLTVQRPHQL